MPLASDLKLNAAKFQLKAISGATKAFNEKLMDIMRGGPLWWEVGAEKYREMRWNGETPLPKPIVLDSGINMAVPSRNPSRSIPCRVFRPTTEIPSKGIFYHVHGGGWVLQSEGSQDVLLQYLADHTSLIFISVGYRLAPEHPYPAPNEDCVDVAEWLVDHGKAELGGGEAELMFMGGDSAGAHLSAVTAFRLLETRKSFGFKGLVLNFGAFDLSGFLPQCHHFELPLVLTREIMSKYVEAYLPNTTQEQRRSMWISPLFADLTKLGGSKLPPALFSCGTLDCLLDDSVFMSAKWGMAGAESILKVYPGACHGFVGFPPESGSETVQAGLDDIVTFLNEKM